jgi:hypothetical protein
MSEDYRLSNEDINALTIPQLRDYIEVQGVEYLRGANLTDRAAYATHAALIRGLIRSKWSPDPMYTQEEFAALFGLRSKSIVTAWKTLGHALVVVGLDPDGETYLLMRNTNVYGYADVRAAVYALGANDASIREVVDRHVTPDGRRKTRSQR